VVVARHALNMNLKRKYFKRIEDLCVNPNGCKYLNGEPSEFNWNNKTQKDDTRKLSSARRFYMYMRDRSLDKCYYLVTLKGNFIRGYRIRWLYDDKPVNTFFDVQIPIICGLKRDEPVREKILIAKQPFKKWREFVYEFRANSPSMGWDDDDKFNMLVNRYK
jgi:hypothetical protein